MFAPTVTPSILIDAASTFCPFGADACQVYEKPSDTRRMRPATGGVAEGFGQTCCSRRASIWAPVHVFTVTVFPKGCTVNRFP